MKQNAKTSECLADICMILGEEFMNSVQFHLDETKSHNQEAISGHFMIAINSFCQNICDFDLLDNYELKVPLI